MNKLLIDTLNTYLADLQVLNTKVHNFHWNLEGPSFFSLHAAYQKVYESLQEEIDDTAERILQIGGRPLSTLKEALAQARLTEAPSQAWSARETLDALKADYTTLVQSLKDAISLAQKAQDEGTADHLVGALKDKEKTLWMLRASAQGN